MSDRTFDLLSAMTGYQCVIWRIPGVVASEMGTAKTSSSLHRKVEKGTGPHEGGALRESYV